MTRRLTEIYQELLNDLHNNEIYAGDLGDEINAVEQILDCVLNTTEATPSHHALKGDILLEKQLFDQSIPFLEKGIHDTKRYNETQIKLSTALFKTNQIEKALPHLKESITVNENDPIPRMMLSYAFFKTGDLTEAQNTLSEISDHLDEMEDLFPEEIKEMKNKFTYHFTTPTPAQS